MPSGRNRRMRTWRSNPRQLPARLSVAERRAFWFLVASAEAKSSVIREKEGRLFPLPSTRNQFLVEGFTHSQRDGPPEGVQGAIGKPPGRLRRGEILCNMGKGRPFPLPSTRNQFLVGGFAHSQRDGPPKGSRGRAESPLVASAEAKSSVIRERQAGSSPCLPQEISFLWEVSPACGRTRYFPTRESTQRVPGAAKGCMSHGRPRTPRC